MKNIKLMKGLVLPDVLLIEQKTKYEIMEAEYEEKNS